MSDIRAVLNSDRSLKAVIDVNGNHSVKSVVNPSQPVKALINNGVNIFTRKSAGTYIHFDVTSEGSNQEFSSPDLEQYPFVEEMNLFKNGVNIEPTQYTKVNTTTIRITSYLFVGDTIDILATGSASGKFEPVGPQGSIQYNNNGNFEGTSDFVYSNTVVTMANAVVSRTLAIANNGNILGNSNVTVNLANSNVVLNHSTLKLEANATISSNTTANIISVNDGSLNFKGNIGLYPSNANLTMSTELDTTKFVNINANVRFNSALNPNITNHTVQLGSASEVKITGGTTGSFLKTDGTGNLSWTSVVPTANTATTAGTVTANSQPNITSVGTLGNLNLSGAANFAGTSTVNFGNVSKLRIPGGINNQVLQISNAVAGTVQWANVPAPTQIANGNVSISLYSSNSTINFAANIGTQEFKVFNEGLASYQTWNNNTSAYVGFLLSVTDTTNAANTGTMFDIRKNTVSLFNIDKSGNVYLGTVPTATIGNINSTRANLGNFNIVGGNLTANANVLFETNTYNVTIHPTDFVANARGNASLVSVATTTVSGANVQVAGNITLNGQVKFNKGIVETYYDGGNVGSSGITTTLSPDLNNGTIQKFTLNGNISLGTIANAQPGISLTLILVQGTSGNALLSSTTWKFAGGDKTLSNSASTTDIISVFDTSGGYYATLSRGYV